MPARAPIADLPPSPALSIVANGPASFAGRKIGVLITDGTERRALDALRKAATAEGALVELIAPEIGGAVLSDGELVPAHQRVDGGPSVLYDAVAILASAEGAARLAAQPAAQDFVHDAHAHAKFIGFTEDARPLLDAAGVADSIDDGYVVLGDRASFAAFVERCRDVRFWPREVPARRCRPRRRPRAERRRRRQRPAEWSQGAGRRGGRGAAKHVPDQGGRERAAADYDAKSGWLPRAWAVRPGGCSQSSWRPSAVRSRK